MSRFSDSDRHRVRSARLLFLMATALLASLATMLSSCEVLAADDAAKPDTGRVVGGVRVTDDGIEIIEDGETRTIEPTEQRGSGNVISISPSGVKVEVNDRAGDVVRVDGPVIVVDSDGAGIVRVFSDAYVGEDRQVEGDVVAVFGSCHVDGEVTGSVVSVFGSVIMGPKASVLGDVVAVGGALDAAPGSTVNGESVSLGFLPISWGIPTLPILLGTIVVGMFLSLFLGWLLFLAAPERMQRTARTISTRTGSSLLLGLLSPPLVIITIGLLFITVIGIPGAFLLPLFYGLLLWGGQVAAAYVLGCKLVRRPLGEGGVTAPLLAGLAFVAGFFLIAAALATPPGFARSIALFFSLLGVLALIGLSTIGSGALLLSRLGSRGDDRTPRAADPAAGGEPPAAGGEAAPGGAAPNPMA